MKKSNILDHILKNLRQLTKKELLQVRFVVGRELIKIKNFRKNKLKSLYLTQEEMRAFVARCKEIPPESQL